MSYASRQGSASIAGGTSAAVLGAGAWGTVIASLLAANGHQVRLYARSVAAAAALNELRENIPYAPGLKLPSGVTATSDLAEAVSGVGAAFIAVPVSAARGALASLAELGYSGVIISCSKGFEVGSSKRISELAAESLPGAPFAVLSGPNLAGEIGRGLPAAATVASEELRVARYVQRLLHQARYRLYTGSDVTGVEVAGALKNVIALASGISDGLGMGENSRATLITRGLAETIRLGAALGGQRATFYGLAGVGDLIATCSSESSRNHQAGVRVARGESAAAVLASGLTAEGIHTVRAVVASAAAQSVELPITREVHRVLFEEKPALAALDDLLSRAEKRE